MDSNNVSEAMGLAGMNPVVGIPADHSHRGSLIVNVTNHDKDLEDDGKRMTTVARNLDMDDNLYGIDRFGKVFAKKKYEVMERPDVWEDDIVEVFKVNKDCEPIIEQLEKEASLPYDKRPIHKPTYIYEAITGHTMYTEDQMYYDRLLEKVELEKMSAVLSGASGGLGRQKNLEQKGNKDSGYIPDSDFPSGTENIATPSINLEQWEQNGRDLKLLREISQMKIELDKDTIYSTNEGFFSNLKQKFNDTRYSIARKGNDYIKYPNAIYRISNKTCYRPFTPDLNYAIMDYLIDVNPEMKGKKISDKIEISKAWWEKHKNDKLTFEMYNYPEPVKKDRMYAINFVNYNTEGMALPMDLEDLINSYNGVQVSIKESVSLQNGMLSLLGIQETSSNEPRFLTQTKIPYDCEVKNCYWTMQGPIKKGQPNLILHHKNKNWRVRAELLLFKEDKIFLHKESKMTQYGTYYRIPGGGIDDPKECIEKAACRECEEECLVIPKNVQYTGKTVFKVYEVQPYWHSHTLNKNGIYYDGSVSFICTGEYDKKYTKYVRKMDQDSMKNGAFYSYDEVKDLLSKEHKKIFEEYLNKK